MPRSTAPLPASAARRCFIALAFLVWCVAASGAPAPFPVPTLLSLDAPAPCTSDAAPFLLRHRPAASTTTPTQLLIFVLAPVLRDLLSFAVAASALLLLLAAALRRLTFCPRGPRRPPTRASRCNRPPVFLFAFAALALLLFAVCPALVPGSAPAPAAPRRPREGPSAAQPATTSRHSRRDAGEQHAGSVHASSSAAAARGRKSPSSSAAPASNRTPAPRRHQREEQRRTQQQHHHRHRHRHQRQHRYTTSRAPSCAPAPPSTQPR